MKNLPTDYIDFLYWLKETSEDVWTREISVDSPHKWLQDAKWLGLDEALIPEIESNYGLAFSEEHKAFLKILHAVDRKPRLAF